MKITKQQLKRIIKEELKAVLEKKRKDEECSSEVDPYERALEAPLAEDELYEKKLTSKARKSLSSSTFVFPKERKFPIPDESHARNALSRANQYSSAPKWYDGSLESLVKRVASAVHKKFPGIETTEKSSKPGKG